jgi:WD40 repeat protein/tetratricopeptide (TPR) repeat protein
MSTPVIPSPDHSTNPAGARSISFGHDAIGNVVITGDGNTVAVTLVVSDSRLLPAATNSHAAINPYKGLDAFYETDAHFFFGRNASVSSLYVLLHKISCASEKRIVPVVGASGSGKSSLVRAGLLSELARRPIGELGAPSVLILRPGATPVAKLAELASRFRPGASSPTEQVRKLGTSGTGWLHEHLSGVNVQHGSGQRVLIVVDQLEEIFTECADPNERKRFLEELALAANKADRLVSVLFTLRSDFVASLESDVPFGKSLREYRFQVAAMSRADLELAIQEPAQLAGFPWPQELVEAFAGQAEGRSGALPLLQFALHQIWPQRNGLARGGWSGKLIEDYLIGAADALFDNAGTQETRTQEQAAIRRAMLAMVQLGEGTADTRRVARLHEFVAAGEDVSCVTRVLAPFATPEARLITISEDNGETTFELTHEALIMSWGRLRAWLGVGPEGLATQVRQDVRIRRRLLSSAVDWKENRGALWQETQLAKLKGFLSRNQADLSQVEFDFLRISRRSAFALKWGFRAGSILLGALVLSVLFLAGLSRRRGEEAKGQAEIVFSNIVSFEVNRMSIDDADRALLVAFEGLQLGGTRRGLASMLDAFEKAGNLELVVPVGESVAALAIDPNGGRLAIATSTHVEVRSAKDFHVVQRLGQPGVDCVEFDPSGRYVVLCLGNNSDHAIGLWDTTNQAGDIIKLKSGLAPQESATGVAFVANGRFLVSAHRDMGQVFDFQSRAVVEGPIGINPPNMSGPGGVIARPNTPYAVFYEGNRLTLVEPKEGSTVVRVVFEADGSVTSGAFSPKGDLLALGYGDGTVGFLPVNDLLQEGSKSRGILKASEVAKGHEHLPAHATAVLSVTFNPTGSVVLTVDNNGIMYQWNASAHTLLSDAPQGECSSGSGIDPIFQRFWATSGMYSHHLAGPYTNARLGAVKVERFHSPAVQWSPDGKRIFTADADERLKVWQFRGHPYACGSANAAVAFQKGITAVAEHTTIRVDVREADGKIHSRRILAHDYVHEVHVDEQATTLVASVSGLVRIWGLPDLKERPWSLSGRLSALSANGEILAIIDHDSRARIYKLSDDSHTEIATIQPEIVRADAIALSHDGKLLAVSGSTDQLNLVEVASQRSRCSIGRVAAASDTSVSRMIFGPGAKTVATAHEKGTITLWSSADCQRLTALEGHPGKVRDLSFADDGSTLASAGSDNTIRLWDTERGKQMGPPLRQDSAVARIRIGERGETIDVSAVHDRFYKIDLSSSSFRSRVCSIAGRSLTVEEWAQSLSPKEYHATCGEGLNSASARLGKLPPTVRDVANHEPKIDLVASRAKQGLVDQAIEGVQAGVATETGLVDPDAIRAEAFRSLSDVAQDHFIYGRDDEALRTLREAAQFAPTSGFDPQVALNTWLARRARVNAEGAAKDGDIDGAIKAFEEAAKLANEFERDRETELSRLKMYARRARAVAAIGRNDAIAAKAELEALNRETNSKTDEGRAATIDAARDLVHALFALGRVRDAELAIKTMMTVFPTLHWETELLIGKIPSLSALDDIKKYVRGQPHKAFAINAGGWGWVTGVQSNEAARKQAMETCQKHSRGDRCRLYAVGDKPSR